MTTPGWRRPEFLIPAAYVAVASVWEIGSEEAVTWLTGSAVQMERWEIVKDLAFVAVCGLALAAGMRRTIRRLGDESRRRVEAEHRLATGLQLLAARLTDAREAEQARIGRDLHDELGQLVTALTLTQRGVERLAARLPAGAGAVELQARAAEARELAGQVLISIRRITADLRPPALQQLGLAAALEQEAEGLSARSGVRCEVEVEPGLCEPPERVALALFRIGQEALTNVARHAEATRVWLRLRAGEGEVVLQVEDDGQGFEPAAHRALGILGMRERAAALGGEVTVRSEPGRGTTVAARLPQAPAAEVVA